MNTANFPENKKRKQEEAKVRQEAYDKLSTQEKLEKINASFPNGAKKQRAKLEAKLNRR